MGMWDKLFKRKEDGPAKLNPIIQRNPLPTAAPRISNARPAVRPEIPELTGPGRSPGLSEAGPVPESDRASGRDTKKRKKSGETATKSRSRASNDQDLVKRGRQRQSEGDHEGAIEDFTKAIELNPNCAQAYASRGVSREARGDGGGAKSDYSKSIQIELMGEINRQMRQNPDVDM